MKLDSREKTAVDTGQKQRVISKAPLYFTLPENTGVKQSSGLEKAYTCLLSALLFVGLGVNSYYLFAPESWGLPLLGLGIVISAVLSLCWSNPRARFVGLFVIAAWLVALFVLLFADITDGIKLTANHLSSLWGQQTGRIEPLFEISALEENYVLVSTLFLVPVCALLACLCSFVVYRLSAAISLSAAALLFLAAWLLASYPPFWSVGLLLLSQVLIVAGRFGARAYFSGRASAAQISAQAGTALLGVAVIALLWAVMPEEYRVPEPVEQARTLAATSLDRARYGVDPSLSMPDGNFFELGSFDKSDETALEVYMEEPDSLWLRGYVGSEYTGSGWQNTDAKTLSENRDLYYWLHEDNFYPQMQLATIAAALDPALSAAASTTMAVNNVGASSRNIYAPYEVLTVNSEHAPANGIGDASLYADGFWGQRTYGYTALPNQVKRYPDLVNYLTAQEEKDSLYLGPYLLDESHYAEYVKEQDLFISDELREQIGSMLDSSLPSDTEELNYTVIRQAIIDALNEAVKYETNPPPINASEDFVLTFLTQTRRGYSVHYASAATMMFRYMDIPARYVEGYLITPDDVAGKEEATTLVLDGTHSHAWVEIYINGLGWVPVEVTPPYFGLMEEPESYEGAPGATNEEPEDSLEDSETSIETMTDLSVAQNQEGISPVFIAALALLALIVLALIVFIVMVLRRRKRIMALREAAFAADDKSVAVIAMFAYLMDIFYARGLKKDGVFLVAQLLKGLHSAELAPIEGFSTAFVSYQIARFSSHDPSQEQCDQASCYKDSVLEELKENCKGFKKIRVRLILCLY